MGDRHQRLWHTTTSLRRRRKRQRRDRLRRRRRRRRRHNLLDPALAVDAHVRRVEPAPAPEGPLGRLRHVVLRGEVAPALEALEEALVVDDGAPPAVGAAAEALAREQDAAAVRVLGRDAVVEAPARERGVEGAHKGAHLVVEGHVCHCEAGALAGARAAVGDALDLDEAGQRAGDEVGVALGGALDVEALDEREAEDCALAVAALLENVEAFEKALPEVAV